MTNHCSVFAKKTLWTMVLLEESNVSALLNNKVAITEAKVDFSSVVCLPPSVVAVNGLDGGGAGDNDDEPVLVALAAAPSPQSEAVANELQELSLQPELTLSLHPGRNPNLPPLSERKNVLQLKLQQRRTREELVSQGIMPPLKSPAAFHEQRRSLERARTEDYLKRKIRSRPERSELVRMHILEETSAEPSLQAKQLKLKRARLADDLNEKIAQRPGPMELVEKNILPVESSLKEAIIVGQVNYPKVADNSSFDEDSSDALSPEQPASHESQGSAPSPLEGRSSEPLATSVSVSPPQVVSQLQVCPDSSEPAFLAEQLSPLPAPPLLPPSLPNGGPAPTAKPTPALIKQSQPKAPGEKPPRSKKAKELKPKVKKLKYHQYIPPDQKQDKGAPPMDSSYAKILQQQQLFLQLQILNQQQQHYNYQTILPAPPKPVGEPQGNSSPASLRTLPAALGGSASGPPGPSGLVRQNSVPCKLGPLPSNLDDMKVAELKQELKMRALPVSGTKTDLIERLRAYQEHTGIPGPASGAPKPGAAPILAKAGEVVVAFPAARLSAGPALMAAGLAPTEVVVATVTSNGMVKFGSTGSTPPVSPTPSERSLLSTGDENSTGGGGGSGDTFGEMVTSPLTQLTLQASPVQILVKEESPVARAERGGRDLESRDKDQMLQEKDKQIEELTRMLRQKQRLVEMLRLQLEREKRAQQAAPPPPPPALPAQVKQEDGFSSCQLTPEPSTTPVLAVTVKQEAMPDEEPPSCLLAPDLSGLLPGPPPALIADATGTHIVLTVTKRDSADDEPRKMGSSQSPSQGPPSPGPSPFLPFSVPPGLQSFFPNGFHKTTLKTSVAPPPSLPQKPSSEPSSPAALQPSQMDLDHQPQALFEAAPGASPLPSLVKKEPPGYDEAVEQQPKPQENGSSSQQMDDLFDILIQSGEISADFKESSPSPGKDASPALPCPSPATPQPPPELPLPLGTSPAPGRLEDFLESSTGLALLPGGQEGPEPLSLIDDLHSQMLSSAAILDHPPSPMDTSELHFAHEPGTGLGLDLAEGHLDSMDWLELSGGPVLSLAPPSHVAPSLFSTDFLDSHDLHLHWDSCL